MKIEVEDFLRNSKFFLQNLNLIILRTFVKTQFKKFCEYHPENYGNVKQFLKYPNHNSVIIILLHRCLLWATTLLLRQINIHFEKLFDFSSSVSLIFHQNWPEMVWVRKPMHSTAMPIPPNIFSCCNPNEQGTRGPEWFHKSRW